MPQIAPKDFFLEKAFDTGLVRSMYLVDQQQIPTHPVLQNIQYVTTGV